MSSPVQTRITLRQAIALDLASFLTAIVGAGVAISLLSLVPFIVWLGGPPPRDPPGLIVLACAALFGGGFAILQHRRRRIVTLLGEGEIVEAAVLRGLHVNLYVQLLVQFHTAHGMVQRKLWLPNTRGPRNLIARRSLLISLPRDGSEDVLVVSLYAPGDPL